MNSSLFIEHYFQEFVRNVKFSVQDTIKRLTKEAKRYVEAISNLDRADQSLSTNLTECGLVHMSDDFRRMVENYHSITTQIGKTVQDLTILLSRTFIEPLKKLLHEFSMIAEAIKRREDLVNVWKYSYERVKKLQEKRDKSASHVAKLEREKRAEEIAAKELRTLHSRLLVTLPWFLHKRLEYMKPSVHALIMIQLDYYGQATGLFTTFMSANDDSRVGTNMNEENFQSLLNAQINRIRSLTIVKDHWVSWEVYREIQSLIFGLKSFGRSNDFRSKKLQIVRSTHGGNRFFKKFQSFYRQNISLRNSRTLLINIKVAVSMIASFVAFHHQGW